MITMPESRRMGSGFTNSRKRSFLSLCRNLGLFAAAAMLVPLAAKAQQSTPLARGTLNWTITETTGQCGPAMPPFMILPYTYNLYSFGSFTFNYQGTNYPLSGVAAWVQDNNSPTGARRLVRSQRR